MMDMRKNDEYDVDDSADDCDDESGAEKYEPIASLIFFSKPTLFVDVNITCSISFVFDYTII